LTIVKDEPPKKRRKTQPAEEVTLETGGEPYEVGGGDGDERGMDVNMDFGNDFGEPQHPLLEEYRL
jgi:hypothetical protein